MCYHLIWAKSCWEKGIKIMQAIENDFKTKVKFVLISCCTYKRADVLNLAFDSIKNLVF